MVHALGTPKRHPASGIFLFRKRVPERLRDAVGRREIKFSLQTRDPAVARIRNLEETVRLERAWLKIDGVAVADGGGAATNSAPAACAPTMPVPTPSISTDSISPSSVETASNWPALILASPPRPLRGIFSSYAKEAQQAPSTVKRWSPVVDRLIAHLGHDDAGRISRADIVGWKDMLLASGMSDITVRDVYLASIKATLQFAVDQGQLVANVAKEVKVRVREAPQERDKGFDGKEAETILTATLRKPSGKISVEMAAARRWVPWIGAYTGARVNEVTPLRRRDFVFRDGIWMIRIRAENAKTRKYREVPLHSHLIEQGLLDYANSRGTQPLFYDPRRSRRGKDANPHHKKVGERLAEWVRTLGIDERSRRTTVGATASRA